MFPIYVRHGVHGEPAQARFGPYSGVAQAGDDVLAAAVNALTAAGLPESTTLAYFGGWTESAFRVPLPYRLTIPGGGGACQATIRHRDDQWVIFGDGVTIAAPVSALPAAPHEAFAVLVATLARATGTTGTWYFYHDGPYGAYCAPEAPVLNGKEPAYLDLVVPSGLPIPDEFYQWSEPGGVYAVRAGDATFTVYADEAPVRIVARAYGIDPDALSLVDRNTWAVAVDLPFP